MASNDAARPSKDIVLKDSGVTLVMSYPIFNDILRFVGGMEDAIVSLMTSQEVRDLVVRRLMTDPKKEIKDIDDLTPSHEVELDIFELEELLAWTMEHVVYFFMKNATGMKASAAKYPALMEKMMTSSNLSEVGSTASETPTKSVGPTE